MILDTRKIFCVLLALTFAGPLTAQDEEDILVDGVPVENAIVGREYAFRLRGEVQTSYDDDELIDEDTAYASFPAEMYTGEIMVRRADRMSLTTLYALWQNQQDLDMTKWSWRVRVPFSDKHTFSFKQNHWDWGDEVERDYLYAAVDCSLPNGFYSYSQYRLKSESGDVTENQLAQYLSWRIGPKLRLGGQGAVSDKENSDMSNPWYAQVFGSYYLKEAFTSLAANARYYDDGNNLVFQDYNFFVYQKLTEKCWARLMYRYYMDENDLSSHAAGAKLKYFFSPRFAVHAGYRWYEHSEDLDLDTFDGGFSIIF